MEGLGGSRSEGRGEEAGGGKEGKRRKEYRGKMDEEEWRSKEEGKGERSRGEGRLEETG